MQLLATDEIFLQRKLRQAKVQIKRLEQLSEEYQDETNSTRKH